MRLADEGRIKEAKELANASMVLKGSPNLWFSFDRSVIPKPVPSYHEILDLKRPEEKKRAQDLRVVSPSLDLLMKLWAGNGLPARARV